jgi:hypothetical protein
MIFVIHKSDKKYPFDPIIPFAKNFLTHLDVIGGEKAEEGATSTCVLGGRPPNGQQRKL